MFDQRFNVAASRAQDRMYLVRSVQLSDLSPKDLRSGLLTHFDNPLVVDKAEAEVLVDRCESGFEKQVYTELVSRGYRVTPQVKTGVYRIDMVVEGSGDLRLAIECDGDEFHGAERWQHDLSRQRVLERAGWIFWRCFASTWTLRKDEVMEELVQHLYRMGIEPMGAIDKASRLVEKRVWKQAGSAETSEEQGTQRSEIVTGDGRTTNQVQEPPASSHNVEVTPTKQGNGRAQQNGAHGHWSLRAPRTVARMEPENQPIAELPELFVVEKHDSVQSALQPTVSSLTAQDWFAMAKWAKEKTYLSPWQRKFAFELGMRVNRGIGISDKQSPYAVQLLEEAIKLGYEVSG
jgi:very-short-patch-repair endonuclease